MDVLWLRLHVGIVYMHNIIIVTILHTTPVHDMVKETSHIIHTYIPVGTPWPCPCWRNRPASFSPPHAVSSPQEACCKTCEHVDNKASSLLTVHDTAQ